MFCSSCKGSNIRHIGPIPASDYFAGQTLKAPIDGGSLYECRLCGLFFRHPCISLELRNYLYETSESEVWGDHQQLRPDWDASSDWIAHSTQGGKILDVGCNDGAFLASFDAGWQRFGIEPSEKAAGKARVQNIEIVGKEVSILDRATESFDVITAFDIIEHVDDPLSFIKIMAGALKKGGILALSSGNTNSLTWRLAKNRYWYCALPEHISFVSPQWCASMASRLSLSTESVILFSRVRAPVFEVFAESIRNLSYLFAPEIFSFIRRMGFGRKNARLHPELAFYPPGWVSATDHFVAIFRKG